jgi:hypothetical protein
MKKILPASVLFLVLGSVFVSAQTNANEPRKPGDPRRPIAIDNLGGIVLPAGFRQESRQGKDSRVGAIIRDDGFTISYDIGRMAGVYADQYFPAYFDRMRKQTHLNPASIEAGIRRFDGAVEWRKEEQVNGETLLLVLLKDSKLIASFPKSYSNFVAQSDTPDKIADFLRIVKTYKSPEKSAR